MKSLFTIIDFLSLLLKTTRKLSCKVAPYFPASTYPIFTGFTKAQLFAISPNWGPSRSRNRVGSGSWRPKAFQSGEARGDRGQWPAVRGRRLSSEFLRGVGLGALRAILTQINQTAAVGPGRPEGLRPPKCESQKPGFVRFSSSTSSTSVTVNSRGRTVGQSWDRVKSILRLTRPSLQPEIFQLSPLSLVFCLKTLAFGNICRVE